MSNGRFRKPESKFTMVSNPVLWDDDLSYKAKGLYATIMSHLTKDNFTLYKTYLLKHCPEGEKAFETIWKDLKNSSYLVQHKMQDEKGQIYWEYELLMEKVHTPKKEGVENAGMEKAPHGKRGVYNKTLENKTLNNNNQLVSQLHIEKSDELTNLFSKAKVDLYESEDLKVTLKETITELHQDQRTKEVVQRIDIFHVDEAIAKFRQAQEQKEIKNPKLYFKRCLLSAIEEGGLRQIV
ncbi:MAG: hypothetical protein ACD_22C00284G0002 [uncultured bacterium]|nr:MAG: hypothetical protein ACD_22C00284G0002 [uncultured bacterium]